MSLPQTPYQINGKQIISNLQLQQNTCIWQWQWNIPFFLQKYHQFNTHTKNYTQRYPKKKIEHTEQATIMHTTTEYEVAMNHYPFCAHSNTRKTNLFGPKSTTCSIISKQFSDSYIFHLWCCGSICDLEFYIEMHSVHCTHTPFPKINRVSSTKEQPYSLNIFHIAEL